MIRTLRIVVVAVIVVSAVAGCAGDGAAGPDPTVTTTAAGSAEGPQRTAELTALSSEFDTADGLAGWLDLHDTEGDLDRIARVDVNATVPGALYLEPTVSSWFEEFRGALLYRQISGDVVLHLRLRVQGATAEVPNRTYSLAGAMARVAQPAGFAGKANWLFATVGTGERPRQVEVKTTQDGASTLSLLSGDEGWVEVALARVGSLLAALYRPDGEQWRVMRRWPRPDLPVELQWGIAAYTDWASFGALQSDPVTANRTAITGIPDMRLSVDFARFYRPVSPPGVDLKAAPEAVLLQVFAPPTP